MDNEIIAREIAAVVRAHLDHRLAEHERRIADQTREQLAASIPAPIKGDPGADGLGFDDMTVEHDGERGFTLKFQQGDRVKTFDFSIPAVLDRGVYSDGKNYERGDAVTYGGSLWIAQRANPDGKPGQADGWRLAVKKGRDGR